MHNTELQGASIPSLCVFWTCRILQGIIQHKITTKRNHTNRASYSEYEQYHTRWQQYGHTKSYQDKPEMCGKYGGSHKSNEGINVKKHQQNANHAEAIILTAINAMKIIVT